MRVRRRRHQSQPTVPVVAAGPWAPNDIGDYEVVKLRLDERERLLFNSVADVAIYVIQSEPTISNRVKMDAYRTAIERLGPVLPPGMVRMLVDATIQQELGLREQYARARRATAKIRQSISAP